MGRPAPPRLGVLSVGDSRPPEHLPDYGRRLRPPLLLHTGGEDNQAVIGCGAELRMYLIG